MSELKPQIDWIPTGKPEWHSGWMNGYARGLELVLNYLGHDVDYDTIMADMGLAFIMQGEENSINVFEGAVDVGWWPLEPLGIIRLNFLEQTVGREIKDIKLPRFEIRKDPVNSYKEWFEPTVISSVNNNKPCLVRVGSAWYIVKFAIALHRDQVLGTNVGYAGEYPLRRGDEFGKYWRTGLKSFSSWKACLEDIEHLGQPFWHMNVVGHLYWNRSTAVRFLKAMQKRHSKTIADHLENAIQRYQAVVVELDKVDTSPEAISSLQGREQLISGIKKMANLESQAVEELEKAAKAFR